MIIIKKDKVLSLYMLNFLYEMHTIKERIDLFEKKYQESFKEFEIRLKSEDEDFEKWDDYIEWKAYLKTYTNLLTQKEQLKDGNYKIS